MDPAQEVRRGFLLTDPIDRERRTGRDAICGCMQRRLTSCGTWTRS